MKRRFAVGLAALALLVFTLVQVSSAQEIRQIYVRGEGVVLVEPDQAYVSLGVTTEAPSAEEAQIKNANTMRNILCCPGRVGYQR